MRTFGQAIGELILQKRKTLGLTQTQLSEDAYNTAGKTRRISELECGLVANPHPKTLDPIIVALGITEAEIEICAKQAAKRPDENLDRAYKEARNLIEAIARQFEHNQPSATLAELDNYLRAKASEWANLRDRIACIEAPEIAASDLKERAALALSDGRFSEVDRLLAEAEDSYQNERTLVEVRKQANIRTTRGDNSLLSGDPNQALQHYQSAVEFFRPFNQEEMASLVNEIAFKNYEIAQRSLKPSFFIASSLLSKLISLENTRSDPRKLAEASYRLSMTLRNDFLAPGKPRNFELIEKAILHAREATSYVGGPDENFLIQSMSLNLANCLMDRAKYQSPRQVDDISEAVRLLEKARDALRHDPQVEELLSHACNSLGSALLASLRIDPTTDEKVIRSKALIAFEDCVTISSQYCEAEAWAAAKANIGRLLAQMAEDLDLQEYEAQFLRIRAISELSAAIEMFPVAAFPFRTADVHESLGNILMQHAVANDLELADIYLSRAVQSFEVVSAVFDREVSPLRWARARERIGSIFAHHATLSNVGSQDSDVRRAIDELKRAAAIYEELDHPTELEVCRKKLASLAGV